MDNLPPLLLAILQAFRPLMRSEVFASFCYLLAGLLIGEAKAGTARASVFAPADYWPQRLSDLFCRHKLSGQALMAKLVEVALSHLYPQGLPGRLFWIADATYTEKPSAHHIASVDWFHRLKYVAGRAKNLKGHCYVFAAHLYLHGDRESAPVGQCPGRGRALYQRTLDPDAGRGPGSTLASAHNRAPRLGDRQRDS